ncbi:hypothetical protein [Pararhodobacter sp. SW119]|uniref:hypothetical protein n=1 Tax=Pararhodobacter sp. SW119 TaxID=2780075 RepID=UPI001AE0C5CF|nr:hypothetical protein [Pararhodobacter sp. SW119]
MPKMQALPAPLADAQDSGTRRAVVRDAAASPWRHCLDLLQSGARPGKLRWAGGKAILFPAGHALNRWQSLSFRLTKKPFHIKINILRDCSSLSNRAQSHAFRALTRFPGSCRSDQT